MRPEGEISEPELGCYQLQHTIHSMHYYDARCVGGCQVHFYVPILVKHLSYGMTDSNPVIYIHTLQ
jgi:hypothetical protein